MQLAPSNDALADEPLAAETLSSDSPCALAEADRSIEAASQDSREAPPDDDASAASGWLGMLLGQGVLSVVDQGMVSGTNFVTNRLLFSTLGESAFGFYASLLSGLLLLRGVQDQLISAPYLLYAQRHRDENLARYTGSMVIHQAIAAALAVIVWTIACLAAALGWLESGLTLPAAILIVTGPVILSREFVRQVSFARLDVGGALAIDGSVAVVQFLGLGFMIALGAVSLPAALLILGVAALSGIAVGMIRRPPLEFSTQDALEHFANNWTFSRWTIASYAMGSTMPLVMPWILAGAKGFSATGYFAACTTLAGVANMFVIGMCNYLCPRMARALEEEGVAGLTRLLGIAAAIFGVVLGSFVGAAWLGGDQLPSLVLGREIPGGGPLLTILAAGVLANGIGMTAGNGLWAIERPQGNFVADAVLFAVTILCTALLVPAGGETGSAVALLVGNVAGTLVRWFVLLWLLRGDDLAPRRT